MKIGCACLGLALLILCLLFGPGLSCSMARAGRDAAKEGIQQSLPDKMIEKQAENDLDDSQGRQGRTRADVAIQSERLREREQEVEALKKGLEARKAYLQAYRDWEGRGEDSFRHEGRTYRAEEAAARADEALSDGEQIRRKLADREPGLKLLRKALGASTESLDKGARTLGVKRDEFETLKIRNEVARSLEAIQQGGLAKDADSGALDEYKRRTYEREARVGLGSASALGAWEAGDPAVGRRERLDQFLSESNRSK